MRRSAPKRTNARRSDRFRRAIWHALTLDTQLYRSTQENPKALQSALAIVVLAALSRAIANILISLLNRLTLPALVMAVSLGIFSVIVCYFFWTFTIWKAGQWLRFNPPSYKALLRPIGFAYAPQILNFIIVLPVLGRAAELVLSMWTLYAVALAVSSAMSISKLKAVFISVLSFPIVQIVPILIQILVQQFV
ncbi:MAG: Yip1 family protein [Cyanobacteria bacterium P01_D01_bin.1]